MLELTFQHLEEHGFVRDNKVWRKGLVEQIRELLLRDPVTTTNPDEINTKARTTPEIRQVILGESGTDEVDRELNTMIGQFLTISTKGYVQKALANGYALCAAKVPRQLIDGEPAKQKWARFVSETPDVVETYAQAVMLDKAVKLTAAANELTVELGRRIPALAARRPTLYRGYHEQLAMALPVEAGS